MKHLSLYAGKTALRRIKKEGLHPGLFKGVAGASGGPKWFTLYGLDRYLYGEFFQQTDQPLFNIGSSAGGWQMACFAQDDPVAAIDRLAYHYSRETYSAKPTVDEISDKAEILLDKVLQNGGEQQIAKNPRIQTHWIVARAKGLCASEKKWLQLSGLLSAATLNALSRKTLGLHFERDIFYGGGAREFSDRSHYQYGDKTKYYRLEEKNVKAALIATGAIPLVLRGIKNIPGATPGIYRDGGIIDYHLDINFTGIDPDNHGLVLYPHFFPMIIPGWFDKSLRWRKAHAANFDNVVVATPSKEHIASLPFGKISDRKDFNTMDADSRFKYWQTVLDKSHLLAVDFQALVKDNQNPNKILPITDII